MDIQKDIEKFKTLGYNALAEEFKKEAEALRVKTYLFRVINTINELDELIKNDVFEAQGIKSIKLNTDDDLNIGYCFSSVELFDENKNKINTKLSNDFIKEYKLLCNLFGYYTFPLESDLCNIKSEENYIELELNDNTKNKLRHYLLNDDLKKAYDYIVMLNKAPEKTTQIKTQTKKI